MIGSAAIETEDNTRQGDFQRPSRRALRGPAAYVAASAFNYCEVAVTNLDGDRIPCCEEDRRAYFVDFIARPDDWPVIDLTAPGVIDVAPGKRASGKERPEPHSITELPFILTCRTAIYAPLARIRSACVLEIEEDATESFSRELQTRPMPPGVKWLRDRRGRWQAWFAWPSGMTRDGKGSLPPGVRLVDDRIEAPVDADQIAEDFWMQRLPPLPLWLAREAGGRDAETTEECITNLPFCRDILQWPTEDGE